MRRVSTASVVWNWMFTGLLAGAAHGALLSMSASLGDLDGVTAVNFVPIAAFGLLFPGALIIPGTILLGALGGALAIAAWATLRHRVDRRGVACLLLIAATVLAVVPEVGSEVVRSAVWGDSLTDPWWINVSAFVIAAALALRGVRRSRTWAEQSRRAAAASNA